MTESSKSTAQQYLRMTRKRLAIRAESRSLRAGATASALYALTGYLGMIGLGKLVIPGLTTGDSFADLGVASLTLVVFAPLAGFAGAVVGFLPHRRQRLRKHHATTFWGAAALSALCVAATAVLLDIPTALSTLLIGLASLLVMRVALLDRQKRIGGLQ